MVKAIYKLILDGNSNQEIAASLVKFYGWPGGIETVRKQIPGLRHLMKLEGIETEEDLLTTSSVTTNKEGEIVSTKKRIISNDKIDLSGMDLIGYTGSSNGGGWPRYKKNERFDIEGYLKKIGKSFSKQKIKKSKGNSKVAVVALADFHFGAAVEGLLGTPDFNSDILAERINNVVNRINSLGFSSVHLALLGDYIESFTGLNHPNSWKQLDRWGAKAVIGVSDLITENIIGKIKNVKSVSMVAGNHDRVTSSNKEDTEGEAAGLIAEFVRRSVNVPVEYHPLVIPKDVDGIRYILTHGDKRSHQRDINGIVFEYGKQGAYNVILGAHWHSRKVSKSSRSKSFQYRDIVAVSHEHTNCRKITVPPLFTGNWYSESGGWGSSAGFAVITKGAAGGVDHFDIEA